MRTCLTMNNLSLQFFTIYWHNFQGDKNLRNNFSSLIGFNLAFRLLKLTDKRGMNTDKLTVASPTTYHTLHFSIFLNNIILPTSLIRYSKLMIKLL